MNPVRNVMLSLALVSASAISFAADPAAPLSRIAFGSCNSQDKPQLVWDGIVSQAPEMFVFLGDNIYGDSEDMNVLKAKYAKLAGLEGFKKVKAAMPIHATWDDHDYGRNDAGSEYAQREASQKVFLDFWGEPADSPRRKRPGIYTSHMFGPEGKRVQLILLDTRYFRTPHIDPANKNAIRGMHGMNESPEATVLGTEQWKWLEGEFKKPAQVRIIGSSIQFAIDFHGNESWAVFPLERQRMLDLIDSTKAGGVIFLSGDVHWAEIAKVERPDRYPIYDITCSGMTHVLGGAIANKNRVGKPFTKQNFGLVDFDWSDSPKVIVSVRDQSGAMVLEQAIPLAEIQPKP